MRSRHRALELRDHVLSRIEQAAPNPHPFRHMYVTEIFPADFYAALHQHMLQAKQNDLTVTRHQDNPSFTNRHFNLFGSADDVVDALRDVFSDMAVELALLGKFYRQPLDVLAASLSIHEEFEYVFTQANRFQNIHVDIPPKFLSFVFYIPEHPALPDDEPRNGTILYDKALAPQFPAPFVGNSVCIFAPHFYSYHGFSSTIDRDALVMFYIDPNALRDWRHSREGKVEEPPFSNLLDSIERKLRQFPLIEYAGGEERVAAERSACRVNAAQGRVSLETAAADA